MPGSGKGPDTEVGWEVAEDKAFTRVVARAPPPRRPPPTTPSRRTSGACARPPPTASASPPATARSPVARTRTAPAADAATAGVRFGVVSCANWESGYFSAYRHLAARGDLDAILHLGDYIYEYATGEYPDAEYVVRQHAPAARDRHARRLPHPARHYKTDPDLQACTPRTR